MGRGKRRKKVRQISSSDSDSNTSLKMTKKSIPAPPAINFKKISCNFHNSDIDSNLNISKQLKKSVPAIKLTENKKLQETITILKKGSSLKHSHANQKELKETNKKVRETAASKIKKPESLTSLSKTIKSPLKSVSSSISSLSPNSNSFVRNFGNCDKDAIQKDMTSPWKIQSLQGEISDDCLLDLDNSISTHAYIQDLILTENINRKSSEDTVQYSSTDSKCNDPSSSSCQRILFKEHNKNIGNIVLLYKCKIHI